MTLLPFESIIIETPLAKDVIFVSLSRNIEPRKIFRLFDSSDTREFEGRLRDNEFEIRRIINYRNPSLPIIKGRIEEIADGTRLTINLRAGAQGIVFMLVCLGAVSVALIDNLMKPDPDSEFILGSLFTLVVVYAVSVGAFWFETHKAKDILTRIVKGKVVDDVN